MARRDGWVSATLALGLLASGCVEAGGGQSQPAATSDAGRFDPGPAPPPADDLDLLLVVDSSCSMTEEQANFAAGLPALFEALGSGDHDRDGVAEARPFESVHVGVATVDMGTGGHTVPTCPNPDLGEDGVLRTEGMTSIPGCDATYPEFLRYEPAVVDAADFAHPAACLATVGTAGCGFEQQLDATLKAVSPAQPQPGTAPGYVPPTFFRGTPGHGDGANLGFVRDDSILAIVLLTDEEDCSARDADLFDPDSPTYTADLNLRCFTHAAQALHPVVRYVNGLAQVRRHPDRLVFLPIVGIPLDLQPPPGGRPDWGPLTSNDPAVRDDRMEERVDPMNPTRLVPSCNEPGTGLAFPPVRIVSVAEGLEGRGARASVASICNSDLSGAFDILLGLLRS